MGLRNKRKELHGLVGAVGVAIALLGFVGGFMAPGLTVALTFGTWIVGATLVTVLTDPPSKG